MKYIVSGTNRKGSRSFQIAKIVQGIYQANGESVEIIDLSTFPIQELAEAQYGGKNLPPAMAGILSKINQAEGLHFIVPEYNGSYPGALKLFIDHWQYPESFEQRPVCFVGLGGIFGGLRPVEHLQQVFGYRNGFIFPHRVFLRDIFKTLQNDELKDPVAMDLLVAQVRGFQKFTQALQSVALDANSLIKERSK